MTTHPAMNIWVLAHVCIILESLYGVHRTSFTVSFNKFGIAGIHLLLRNQVMLYLIVAFLGDVWNTQFDTVRAWPGQKQFKRVDSTVPQRQLHKLIMTGDRDPYLALATTLWIFFYGFLMFNASSYR